MWASPSIMTCMPVTGVCDKSHAITAAAPRKKANGETAMRPIRSGTNCSCRPAFPATTMSTGLGRFFGGVHSVCAAWGTLLRSCAPASRRCAGWSCGRAASYRPMLCQDSRVDSSLAIRASCAASNVGSDFLAGVLLARVVLVIFTLQGWW